ncbi:MAG: hypothetical protein ABSB42_02005 [Tepidisphaeraceae bacterium]
MPDEPVLTPQPDFDRATRRDEDAYWAAALALAIPAGDRKRTNAPRRHRRRLCYCMEVAWRQSFRITLLRVGCDTPKKSPTPTTAK